MELYRGKSKCSCGRRAKYRVLMVFSKFACEMHKQRLVGLKSKIDLEDLTEADYATWCRV